MTFPQTIKHKEYKTEIAKAIRNIASLPGGLKCNFLVTIRGENNTLIAKQWKRKAPKTLSDNEVLITF
jgi:hypothetical protein